MAKVFIGIILLLVSCLVNIGLSLDPNEIEELERELVDLEIDRAKRESLENKYSWDDADCNDQIGDATCQKFRRMKLCHKDYRLKKLCRETCGFCGRMPAVPHCAKSSMGCCWDERTPKTDPEGSNCPVCEDKRGQLRICRMFEADCNSNKDAGKYMRNVCPKTCSVCGTGAICRDNPDQELFCVDWQKQGMCDSNRPMMVVYCRRTCGLC